MAFPPRVEKFLCCLNLEVGGYVMGVFMALIMAITIGFIIDEIGYLIWYDSLPNHNVSFGMWFLMSCLLTYYILYFLACILLIVGTKQVKVSLNKLQNLISYFTERCKNVEVVHYFHVCQCHFCFPANHLDRMGRNYQCDNLGVFCFLLLDLHRKFEEIL